MQSGNDAAMPPARNEATLSFCQASRSVRITTAILVSNCMNFPKSVRCSFGRHPVTTEGSLTLYRYLLLTAILGRRDVHVPAKHPVEMAQIGKAAQKGDFLERQAVLAQMLARPLHLAFQDIGMRPGSVVRLEFARKLNRRAVADAGQFLERDVPEDVLLDILFDHSRMGRPETSLRTGQFEL